MKFSVALMLPLFVAAASAAQTTASSAHPDRAAARPSLAPARGAVLNWKIDAGHSELSFAIRHLLNRVRGSFNQWEGTIAADPDDWSTAQVDVRIQAASIDTNHDKRDSDLKGSDFFDAERFPVITFRSSKVERQGDAVTLTGALSMRGVTRPVVLRGGMVGATKDAKGKRRVGFEAKTTISRKEFGIVWNRIVDNGTLLGDEVNVEMSIAAVEQ